MHSAPGFKFEVTRTELSKHLEARVAHHRERAKFYVDKAANLRVTAEKCAAGEQGVTLPDEILDAISVEPHFGGYAQRPRGMGVVPRAGAVMSVGALVQQEAAGARKRIENAQDAIKSQVAEQVERLTNQYEQTAELHGTRADELDFFLAHLPGTTKFELTHGDLFKFELIKRPSFGGTYMQAPLHGLGDYVDVERF